MNDLEKTARRIEIVEKLKQAKELIKQSQTELLEMCVDKAHPLKERWDMWCKFADKTQSHYYRPKNTCPLLTELLEFANDACEFSRHERIDYNQYMEILCDHYDDEIGGGHRNNKDRINAILKKHISEIRDSKIDSITNESSSKNDSISVVSLPKTMDEFQDMLEELVMKSNFGSVTYDW